ncbi:hypothetical protein [Sphaerisporangium aureirubrum]|uniref:Uncharacterized protein n=1 Tax=Sphaerisporangium aureirubrum TaxID=1544736 RepID=A0ABW1NNR7_9ACTN
MTHIGRKLGAILAGIGLGMAAATVPANPAAAAPEVDDFFVCGGYEPACEGGYTEGTIRWLNRSAQIHGVVFDRGEGSTTAIFEAFTASNVKVDSQTRTADDDGYINGRTVPFDFPIGDPDLVGGINRIRITVCFNLTPRDCSKQANETRG